MNEKRKCPRCNLLIDSSLTSCPYCGCVIEDEEKIIEDIQENKEETKKEKKYNYFSFPTRVINMPNWMNISLFLIGFLGIQAVATILSIFLISFNYYFSTTTLGIGYLNFACYFIVLGIYLVVARKYFIEFISPFKKGRTYLMGLSYGLLLIVVSLIISNITSLIFPTTSSNNNQSSIESITTSLPILSLIVFGLIGPFVEEISYRVGLFGFLRKKGILFAYLISAIIFGLIHFDFTTIYQGLSSTEFLTELINIPSYLISGLLLSYFYDKEGFGASFIAHMVNNLFSIILIIIYSLI